MKELHPSAPLTIGFVGLGVMGVPMARHLGESGHRVQGFDVAAVALERLHEAHDAAILCSSARGASMVDAPVSGAQWGAEAAELVFMVGGAPADVQRVRPLLDAMGKQVFHLGPLGAGHTMKCLNNLVTAMTLTATAEVLATGTRCGLDPAVMTDVLNASTGGSWITRT